MTEHAIPRIAVFDVNAVDCAQTADALRGYFGEDTAEVSEFTEMQTFVQYFRDCQSSGDAYYDMVFLGVDDMLGVEAGRNIRDIASRCAIFHVSHSEDYMLEAFRQITRDYLIKPINSRQIGDCVRRLDFCNSS